MPHRCAAREAPMSRVPSLLIALLAFTANGASATYYSVTGGGAQFWVGDFRPVPLRPLTPPATGTMFPLLVIPVNPSPSKALVQQTAGPDPKQITIPPGVLHRKAPGPQLLGVHHRRPPFLQLRTNIEFSAPAAPLGAAVLKAGGRTGPPVVSFFPSGGSRIRYQKTAAQFGGPLQARVQPATPVRDWLFPGGKLPCKHPLLGGADSFCLAQLIARYPGSLAPFGAKVGFTTTTPGGPAPMSPNVAAVSVPNTTGLIAKTAPAKNFGSLTDMVTSAGFPWTTGRVVISEPSALAVYEKFTITGMDSRMNGLGTISLVSGALTDRKVTGPNASRGWLRLTVPEPGATVGAVAALGALAACHFAARRRL
jgi:hypothetical protein